MSDELIARLQRENLKLHEVMAAIRALPRHELNFGVFWVKWEDLSRLLGDKEQP